MNVSRDTIFNACITQDNIEKCFLSKAEFTIQNGVVRDRFSPIEKGDKYIWMWHGSDNVANGEV